jgi:negative regulator of sigma E activity
MKRTMKERPRVAAAAGLGVVALLLLGVAIGALIATGPSAASTTTQLRLASAESTARETARRLRLVEADATRAKDALQRSEQRSHTLARRNAELDRALRKPRRAPHRHAQRLGGRSSNDR